MGTTTLNNGVVVGDINVSNSWGGQTAADAGSGLVFFRDIGVNGSIWYSDGEKFIQTGDVLLFNPSIPIGIPPSGSIGDNGALTLGTALSEIMPPCYMYFSANQIASGQSAGKYYVVMSSTTLGTIYNNTYVSGEPTIPASPTPFVSTGPGAYTRTTAEISLLSYTLKGGLMGKKGSVFSRFWAQINNTAGTKTLKVLFGGTSTYNVGVGTGVFSFEDIKVSFKNRNATDKQLCTPSGLTGGASGTASDFVRLTKDTTNDIAIEWTLTGAVSTDWGFYHNILLMLMHNDG